jgi:type II secretory pathway component PulF
MMLWDLRYISKNRVLSFLVCRMREDLRNGLSLSSPLQRYRTFPKLVGKMIEVAESSGRMPEVLEMLLDFYEVSTIDNSGAKTFTKLSSGSF